LIKYDIYSDKKNLLNFLFIIEFGKGFFPQKYEAGQPFLTDNNQKCFLSIKSSY